MDQKVIIQKITGVTLVAVLAICLCFVNIQPVYAEEVTDDLEAEIAEKKAAGIEVHELVSDDGKVMGYFLPNAEMDEREAKTTRGSFNWKTAPNTDTWSNNNISFVKGDKIYVSSSQNPSGAGCVSYVGLRDNDNGSFGYPSSSITTNGWSNGVIVVGYSGHFSFSIRNKSSRTITYSGSYSF